MKIKKLIALAVAVLTITVAFAPAAMATNAPYSWSNWPLQKESNHDFYYTVAIQRYLNTHNPASLTIDGSFGWRTAEAVEDFQGHYSGLTVDGKVGSNTWAKMRSLLVHESDYNGSTGINAVIRYGLFHITKASGAVSPATNFKYSTENSTTTWRVYTAISGVSNTANWHVICD